MIEMFDLAPRAGKEVAHGSVLYAGDINFELGKTL